MITLLAKRVSSQGFQQSLLIVTVGLWIAGFTEYAVVAMLLLLLVIVIQNLWLAYNGLFE